MPNSGQVRSLASSQQLLSQTFCGFQSRDHFLHCDQCDHITLQSIVTKQQKRHSRAAIVAQI